MAQYYDRLEPFPRVRPSSGLNPQVRVKLLTGLNPQVGVKLLSGLNPQARGRLQARLKNGALCRRFFNLAAIARGR